MWEGGGRIQHSLRTVGMRFELSSGSLMDQFMALTFFLPPSELSQGWSGLLASSCQKCLKTDLLATASWGKR